MEWSGVMPAITTKFSNDDKLDLGLFNKNLDFQLQAGIDAIVLGGSLGEASTLTQEEKNILTQKIFEPVHRVIAQKNVLYKTFLYHCFYIGGGKK